METKQSQSKQIKFYGSPDAGFWWIEFDYINCINN